ncbi:MAG: transcriptional regulator [Candidatus Magnetoglobus multicellularis str. Araruama]|uniref:Transcriptional regulator n=1 Tax=Candidatus Magnetoglobus multicellularis str. Araruama TaxID=890399 RepID=A0A1V1P3E9_9BACT|nr:MAG: transcriptional regulator [Candidatus Magnetoglobus multicellularis str. Araruama]
MDINVKTGTIKDFFNSARETARQIDQGVKLTPKHTIWVDIDDMISLLKPNRTKLITYLRGKKKILLNQLSTDLERSSRSIKQDLKILSKYNLIQILDEKQIGKIVQPTFGTRKIEIRSTI